jgi:hypothetical protein
MLKSIELSGNEATVRLSIAVSPETLRAIAPSPRRRGGPAPSDPPNPGPEK